MIFFLLLAKKFFFICITINHIRYKVGGASKPSPDIVRDGTAGRQLADGTAGGEVYNLQFIINSLLFRVNSL